MKSHSRPGLHITERDEKLLQYLYENKVATRVQIARDLEWHGCAKYLHKRLAKLIQYRLVSGRYSPETGHTLIYSLGDEGFKRFIDPDKQLRKEFQSQSVEHDLALNDCRAILESTREINQYHTENILKGHGRRLFDADYFPFLEAHPDAIVEVIFPSGGRSILTLEYESSRKYQNRYEKLFRSYYSKSEIPGVLYICKTQELMKRIQTEEKKTYENIKYKFFYTTFEDLKQDSSIVFENLEGKKIVLNRVSKSSDLHDDLEGQRSSTSNSKRPKVNPPNPSESQASGSKKSPADSIASWPTSLDPILLSKLNQSFCNYLSLSTIHPAISDQLQTSVADNNVLLTDTGATILLKAIDKILKQGAFQFQTESRKNNISTKIQDKNRSKANHIPSSTKKMISPAKMENH